MQGISNANAPFFSNSDDGFTAVIMQGTERGVYKQLEDRCIAIKHSSNNGKSFRTFEVHQEAISWLMC